LQLAFASNPGTFAFQCLATIEEEFLLPSVELRGRYPMSFADIGNRLLLDQVFFQDEYFGLPAKMTAGDGLWFCGYAWTSAIEITVILIFAESKSMFSSEP
jgi:hypothetical protein